MITETMIEFRVIFNSEKQSIERDMMELTKVPIPKVQDAIAILFRRAHALEEYVTKIFNSFPPFDARIYVEVVKAISERLSQLRGKLTPKPKFAFKSRNTPSSSKLLKKPLCALEFTNVNHSLCVMFENRTREHLFIERLESTTSNEMEVENVHLGGIPVNMSSLQYIDGARDVALRNLTDCTVNLIHNTPLRSIHIKGLKRCALVIPPVSGSILVYDCEDSVIIGACRKSHMYNSTNMDVYLHVTSIPTIEDCVNMRFASYPYQNIFPMDPDQLNELFLSANLSLNHNYYDRVKDFNWLLQQNSPNWRILDPITELRSGIAQVIIAKNYIPTGGTISLDACE